MHVFDECGQEFCFVRQKKMFQVLLSASRAMIEDLGTLSPTM